MTLNGTMAVILNSTLAISTVAELLDEIIVTDIKSNAGLV